MCLIWVSGMYNVPWVCFHMHVGVFLSRFQREGARPKNHLEPTMEMIEIGNRLRARLVRAARSKPADTGYFFVDVEPAVLQQRGVIDLFVQYHSTWCCVRNFSVFHPLSEFSRPYRGGLLPRKYEDGLFCGTRRKGSLPLNGPGGDWKMAFICHTPHSDSKYSISRPKKKITALLCSPLWRHDRGSLNGCGRNDMKGWHMIKLWR